MGALIIGTLLAVGALAFVLYPIFFGVSRTVVCDAGATVRNERESAVVALREIEFDRATGKLSDADYAELKARYTKEAIAAMREARDGSAAAAAPSDDEIEAAVQAYRSRTKGAAVCVSCGPRPEADAVFCSSCGRYLRDRCAGCGAPVVAPDARYCLSCGGALAA
ncbi:MAG TPA: zinc ribbon domain-containing protein [Gemmatimonadaceae bacterium]|nr:zinc ribbon domain-containing protein [Gemmatimonadaceae bacterium]